MTGGPGKEHGTNKPPPTRRVQERSKGDTTCPITSQNPSLWNPSWLNKVCTTRKDSESEWLAKDNPETNPITIKPKTSSHMAELFSWFPLPYCSTLWCPFPIKSLALSAHVSPWTIHFWVLDKSPVSGPGRGPPSCNTFRRSFSLHRTDQLQLLQHQWLGYRLGLLWCWMVYLEHELKSFCCFLRMNLSTAFWTLVLIVRATPFLLWDSCPQ